MGYVPKPNIVWRGAHPSNFTVGRPIARDGRTTQHHIVGSAESAVLVFNRAGRGASSHLVMTNFPDVQAYQCVDFNNTAWCDGNWDSNCKTISIENHGDWRFGYRDEQVIKNCVWVVAWLIENYGVTYSIRHRDVSATACPGDFPVEEVWTKAKALIKEWKDKATVKPEWLANRKPISKTVYAQNDGLFLYNLNDTTKPADDRRFAINQSFEIGSETTVGGRKFYITVSSTNTNSPAGIAVLEVADTPFTPKPIEPETPYWYDSIIDTDNKELYVLRATPLIDLENGHPFVKDGKEVWYQAGDIIKDISAYTIIEGVTYQLTEWTYQQVKKGEWERYGNGIRSSDLTTDPLACPHGTPANPTQPEEPEDDTEFEPKPVEPPEGINEPLPNWFIQFIKKIIDFILNLIKKGN